MTDEQLDKLIAVLRDLEWQLGAISSNLSLANRLKAKEMGIPCVYWDPNVEPWPLRKHGEEAGLDRILVGVPREMRVKPE